MLDRIITDLLAKPKPGWRLGRPARQAQQYRVNLISRHGAESASRRTTAADNRKRGIDWLVRQQNQDHSWPLNEAAKEGSWTTALAITALGDNAENSERVLAAARWLLEQEGSKPGILAEIILWATGKSSVNKAQQRSHRLVLGAEFI